MPNADEARESVRARIKALRNIDKKAPSMSIENICASLKKARNVYLVFDNNAERLTYQQRILKEATDAMNREPLGGLPVGSLAGERVYQWANGAEIAFSTSVPGDLKGNLFMEKRPADTDIVRPEIPDTWKTKKN